MTDYTAAKKFIQTISTTNSFIWKIGFHLLSCFSTGPQRIVCLNWKWKKIGMFFFSLFLGATQSFLKYQTNGFSTTIIDINIWMCSSIENALLNRSTLISLRHSYPICIIYIYRLFCLVSFLEIIWRTVQRPCGYFGGHFKCRRS